MPGLAALGGGEDEAAALAHRGGGQQMIGAPAGRVAVDRPDPASRIQAAASGVAQLVPARRARRARNTRRPFSPRSRPARRAAPARPGSRPARRSRSPGRAARRPSCSTSTPSGRCGAMPSQWNTSGINSWKRMSCTPATHSVRLEIGLGACRRRAAACARCRPGISSPRRGRGPPCGCRRRGRPRPAARSAAQTSTPCAR